MSSLRSRLRGRTRQTAFTHSLLLVGLSVMGIVIVALKTKTQSTGQTISFAVIGAVLQTALIGLLYEVLLRQDVENDAFERLHLSADVRFSGLTRIVNHSGVDWPTVLSGNDDIVIVTPNPMRLLGSHDTTLLLPPQRRRRVYIAVSKTCGGDVSRWTNEFEDRWKVALPKHDLIGFRLDGPINYEVVAYGETVLVLLPGSTDPAGSSSSRILEFRRNEQDGIGSWLYGQVQSLKKDTSASWGHSPNSTARSAQPVPGPAEPEDWA